MKLNVSERLLVNNAARAFVQRFFEAPVLRKLGGSVEGLQVLEVGCGRGVGIELLIQQFGASHVFGIDLDPVQIERASKRLAERYESRWTLAVSSVERLPFADALASFIMFRYGRTVLRR